MATRMSTPTTTAQKQSDPKVDEEVTKKTKQEEVLDRQEDLFWQIKKQIWSEKVQSFRSGPFMKLAMFCLCSLLMILSMKESVRSVKERKGLAGGLSLPFTKVEIDDGVAQWSTERVCRHFGVETASAVTFAFRVDSMKMLREVMTIERVDVVVVDVAYSEVTVASSIGNRKIGRAKIGKDKTYAVPVVQRSAYKQSEFTFDEFLNEFVRKNTRKGLMVNFRDPRAVVPTLGLLSEELKYERIKGPLIVHAEILPGPGGYRPQMGSVLKISPLELNMREADVRDPPIPSAKIEYKKNAETGMIEKQGDDRYDNLLVPFHPSAFVDKVRTFVPGAILSIAWSAHGGCVDKENIGASRTDLDGLDAIDEDLSRLSGGLKKIDLSAALYDYNINEKALSYEPMRGLTDDMVNDAFELLKTWKGDVIFNVPACIIGGDIRARFDGTEPPHKRLVRKKLGYSVMINGVVDKNLQNVLKNREFKWSLDPSNTFSGDAMDERGKPIVQGLLAKAGPPKFREGQVLGKYTGKQWGEYAHNTDWHTNGWP
jgi:hypothetical protein